MTQTIKPPLPLLVCLALCGCKHHHDFTDQDYMRIERATVGDHVWEPRTEGEQLIVRACRKCGVLRLETKTSWSQPTSINAATNIALYSSFTNVTPSYTFAYQLDCNDQPIVEVLTNGEVNIYVELSEASRAFWCDLERVVKESQRPFAVPNWTTLTNTTP